MPAQTLDQPKRIPLIVVPGNRDTSTSKDARLVNGYIDYNSVTGEYFINKRPGMSQHSQPPGTAAAGQGVFLWRGDVYSVFGGHLYKGTTDKGAVDATGGVYRFSATLGATPRLVLGNGVKAYTYEDGGGLALITDADFPSTFVKGWAFLDGTTYVTRADAGIQGSAINNPTSWDPLNVIIAQVEPDQAVALAKQLVYAVVLKQESIEAFYDAGNATGSPLAPVQGTKISYGCLSQDGVRDLDGDLYFPCTAKQAGPQVGLISKMAFQVISTPAVDRLLTNKDFTAVSSFVVKIEGHKFYVLTLSASNLTVVYDAATGMWGQWADTSGNYLPIVASASLANGTQTVLQHATNGKLYYADSQYLNDDGVLFSTDIYTPNFDAGVDRRKTMNLMRFLADQVVGSHLDVRCSDDDYRTWSNFRRVDLSTRRPFLTNCGTFYRRAWHMRHRANTRFRIAAVDYQLDIGSL